MVDHAQLVEIGLSSSRIGRWVKEGRLRPRHRGVYAVGHAPDTPESRWSGAVLACRPQAALSHRSAARAHGLVGAEGHRISVTVNPSRCPRPPGIQVHRAALVAAELTRHRGIPVTSVERTLIDIAGTMSGERLRRAYREAQFLRTLNLPALERALERRPRPSLRALMLDGRQDLTASEDVLLDICDRHRIRRPQTQKRVGPKRVDFVWQPENVVIEADSWLAHGTPAAYQEDRTVTNELQLLGFQVLRFTWEDLIRRPAKVAATIERALERATRAE